MHTIEAHFIAGEKQAVDPRAGFFEVRDSSTEEVIARVAHGEARDAERAADAAVLASVACAELDVEARASAMERLSDLVLEHKDALADGIARVVGMPKKLAVPVQVEGPARSIRRYAELLRELPAEERIGNSTVLLQPMGVVAAITPWNYPLNQIVHKVVPALLSGSAVVLKPSELAPQAAELLAELIGRLDLPRGAFNLVWGDGPTVGEALVTHAEVTMVTFTGSTRAGRRVAELASQTIKRVALELGGKSANLILEDADLERAVKVGVSNAFLNSGQTCSAQTRMLVPRARLAEVESLAKAAAEKLTLGPALDPATRLGPLISAAQRDRVRNFIQTGIEQGAKLVTGGGERPGHLPRGFFVSPTVFSEVRPEMTIAREEIFGPVLAILPYEDEEQGIRIANDGVYGLGGGVWSEDRERAVKIARRLRTGQVDINGGAFNPEAPFGGFKQSGIGREGGKHGLLEFFELQSLQG